MHFELKTLEFNRITKILETFCNTETTKMLAHHLLPSSQIDECLFSLNQTDEMYQLISRFQSMPFIEDFDIFELLNKIEKVTHLSIKEILTIKLFIKMIQNIIVYFKQASKEKKQFESLNDDFEKLLFLDKLYDDISRVIDYDGFVYDDASTLLKEIREKLKHRELEKTKLSQTLIHKYQSFLSESKFVMRNNRLTLAVKDSYKNKISGIVHDVSQTNQTIYIEPKEMLDKMHEIDMLKHQEHNEIIVILTSLTMKIKLEHASLFNNLEIAIKLDLIHAKALLAKKMNAYKPSLNQDGHIALIKARHPLIDERVVVPIDVFFDETHHSMFITGPNTGGKTVALKTIGLLHLMAQSGLLIPASQNSNLNVFNQIFADIGDEQSIDQSLSTFSSHMTKIIKMTQTVTDNSLILLDELGGGTDPDQGISLARAIIEFFFKFKVNVILTTHYAELKTYAYEKEGVMVASVAFEESTLAPLYHLQIGVSGSSHALKIAKRLGLNDDIIEKATSFYDSKQTDLSKLMEQLNRERILSLEQQAKLEETQKILNQNVTDYEAKILNLDQSKEKVIKDLSSKFKQQYEEKIKEISDILEDLKAKKAIDIPQYAQIKQKIGLKTAEQYEQTHDVLKVNDQVYIKPYEQYGYISNIKNDQVFVKFGQFEMAFETSDLRKEAPLKEQKRKVIHKKFDESIIPKASLSSFEIDLRGVRYEEVHYLLDEQIDQAVLARLTQITIIHGYGTGALKDAVNKFLKKHAHVKSYRPGTHEEGYHGVTVVTLK